MSDIFVDTSALYAFVNKNDKFHHQVVKYLKTTPDTLVTTNFIFAETLSLITKRVGKKIAIKFGEHLKKSGKILIMYLPEDYQEKAWKLFSEDEKIGFDYIDATCFVFMQETGIETALSFDIHFIQAGFKLKQFQG